MAKDINIGGRLHSIATGNVVAGADEILDDNLGKKQTQINAETYSLVESVNNALDALNPDQQEALAVAAKANANEAKLGYYVCDTDADVAAKTIVAANYVLGTGGNIRIKMTNANTADAVTLNINNAGAKALFYNGAQASSTNSWEAGEVVVVYYDGTQYQCASGGDGKFATGENVPDIFIEQTLSEDNDALPTGKAVSDALRETAAAVIEEIGDHITIEGDVINNPDNEDITSQEVSGVSILKFKDKLHAPANYSGLGRKYLRKNVHTVEAVTHVNRTEITIPNSFTYLIDLDNHTCDYTNNSNKFTTRNIGWHGDVQAGDTFEILGSSMTAAYASELYPRWRLWVMVDPVSKEILQDEHGNYLMADAAVNHEGDGVVITAPRACHLIIGFWTGLSSGGIHKLNRITTESVQREVNLFDSSLCAEQNTQYIVQYDYDLNGGKITLPKGSVLKFEGGTIGNGSAFNATILGDDATIDANLTQVFSPNVVLSGTWRNETFHPEWFGAKGDGVTDDTQALQATLNLGNSISIPLNITVKLNKTYLFTDTLIIYANTTLYGNAIMSSGNSFKGYTLHAVFSDPHKCAIMSSNMAALPYNAGAARTQIDGGSIKYCDGIHIRNVVLQGDTVEYVRDGETIQMPIFCGIKITASSLSSIKDSCIRGFWYGVARFATWYSSDEDVFISAYKCGYYAGYDMNNFSIRDGYINANNNTGIEITSAEKFNSDPSTYSYGVLAVYASGGLYNVISEGADYGRWYCAHSCIVDIHSWMEAIKNYCYSVKGGARVTIIEGIFISANFLESYDSTNVRLVGMKPPGAVSVGKYDTFEVDFAGSKSSNIYKGIGKRCSTSIYDPDLKKRLWWSADNFYGGSDGYNLQSVFSGTVEEAPTDFNLKDGSVFMKIESNGTVRPVFQKTAGSRCIVRLSVSALPSSNGKVQVKFFNYVLNINVTTESTSESILNVVNNAIFSSIKDANGVRISDMYADFKRDNLYLYKNVAGIHTTDEFGFTDTDNTGTSMNFTYTSMGTVPEFVDAMGMGISAELSSSVLPATAPDGASLLWNDTMVYHNNGSWYDFDGNKISYDFRLTSGNEDNTVVNGGASVTFQILSTYKNIADNIIVVDDYETNSTLQNNGSGQFTLTVQVAANKLTSERTQSVTLTQLSSNVEITLTFTQEAAASASNILILDNAFKTELVSRYDKNGDGEISYDEAMLPTNLAVNNQFESKGIEDIDSFNYFSNIKKLRYGVFSNNPIEHFVGKNITELQHDPYFSNTSIQYAYFPKAKYTDYNRNNIWYGQFKSCKHLIGVRYDKIAVLGNEFNDSSIQFLIVLSPLVIKIGTTADLPSKIYVRNSLVDKYKNTDVWYGIADRILPISQFLNDFPNTPSFMTKGLSSYYIETPTISTSGLFADRPTTGINDGFVYFATDLGTDGKPIWYTGSTWVDATGEVISV